MAKLTKIKKSTILVILGFIFLGLQFLFLILGFDNSLVLGLALGFFISGIIADEEKEEK